MSGQADIFRGGEGDAWFTRNQSHLNAYDPATDPIAQAIRTCGLRPQRICDLGCSSGHRLSALCADPATQGCGVEPSAAAIAAAQARDPQRTWLQGTIDAHPPLPFTADLVIISFVLHWVDRDRLLSALAAIDAAVAPGGHVIIHDFWPDRPERRAYHHLPGAGVFTWKADYPSMLEATGLYRPVLRHTLAYPDFRLSGSPETRSLLAVLQRRHAHEIPEA